jgi:L-aspartate oxidase
MKEDRNKRRADIDVIPEAVVVAVPRHSESARFIIRDAAWLGAGIVRSEEALKEGLTVLDSMESEWESVPSPSLEQLETSNLLIVARVILRCALKRLESRGAHYRSDYPARNDKEFGRHTWTEPSGRTVIGKRP